MVLASLQHEWHFCHCGVGASQLLQPHQNHRILDSPAYEGTHKDHWGPTAGPAQGSPDNHPRITMYLRALFNCFLSSFSLGSVTTSLGTLFQWQTAFWVTNLFRITRLNVPWDSFIPFSCVLSLSPETRNQYLPLYLPSQGRYFKMEIILSGSI